jgi:nitrogen fixation NifU-like protein
MDIEYTDKVLSHFLQPHNIGRIDNPDGVGQVGDESCGDIFVMFISVQDNRIVNVKYLVRGCGAAIATCSATSDLAKGMTLEEAMELNDDDIAAELGGLPLAKLHCSNMAATALHHAIKDYLDGIDRPDGASLNTPEELARSAPR